MVYRFPLQAVQQLRARERDTAAETLAQARLAESKLSEEIERLLQEHAEQMPVQAQAGLGAVSPQTIMESQRYQAHLLAQVSQLRDQLELVRGEVEKRRQILVKREQSVHALEQLDEQRRAEWQVNEDSRAQETLDEWASYHHWKHA